ncbi:hypothetical protein D0S45_19770 [Marinifilum sp. JC120]|nr:hypothetical protein D0S45_19770 [Marinifilum sp. JC120]
MTKIKKSIALDTNFEKTFDHIGMTALNTTETDTTESLITELTRPEGWGVSVADIIGQNSVRLDAEHYNPKISKNMEMLEASKYGLLPLADLAQIDLPGQFVRIWAKDAEHGIPYLNATDLMSFAALGEPAQLRYLSKATDVNIDRLIVREGMILVTCSGTLGRVFEVPKALDGWVGTHDIIRVIPTDPAMKGYIRAFLSSSYAQTQILSHTHGGQIDHVTANQIRSCLVPQLSDKQMRAISIQMDKSEKMKQKAAGMVLTSLSQIKEALDNV